ncbi:MAG TPA: glycoside hydrolase family 127 protein, partial [Candidatus Marinimicrobia bacterium]|nr:glycoside hydrolase family 127 protein [Candidatus Neomarinimicrobiota bacterium]
MNKPNRLFCLLLLTSIPIWAETQPTLSDYPISAVDIKNVEINDAFWLPKIKIIQDTTIQYAFKKCEEEGRMENFL